MMKNKEQFFKKIHTDNKDKIYRLCLGFTGNRADADDLMQEIVIAIWKGLDQFKNESAVSTWMYRIATNTAILFTKRKKRSFEKFVTKDFEIIKAEEPNISHQDKEQKTNQLYSAIATLKEIDRIIIGLLLENNPYNEIANITGMSTTNIGARINRIKKTLRKKLQNHE